MFLYDFLNPIKTSIHNGVRMAKKIVLSYQYPIWRDKDYIDVTQYFSHFLNVCLSGIDSKSNTQTVLLTSQAGFKS